QFRGFVFTRRPSVTAACESDQPPPIARRETLSCSASRRIPCSAATVSCKSPRKSVVGAGGFHTSYKRSYACTTFLCRFVHWPGGLTVTTALRLLSGGMALLLLRYWQRYE